MNFTFVKQDYDTIKQEISYSYPDIYVFQIQIHLTND